MPHLRRSLRIGMLTGHWTPFGKRRRRGLLVPLYTFPNRRLHQAHRFIGKFQSKQEPTAKLGNLHTRRRIRGFLLFVFVRGPRMAYRYGHRRLVSVERYILGICKSSRGASRKNY